VCLEKAGNCKGGIKGGGSKKTVARGGKTDGNDPEALLRSSKMGEKIQIISTKEGRLKASAETSRGSVTPKSMSKLIPIERKEKFGGEDFFKGSS